MIFGFLKIINFGSVYHQLCMFVGCCFLYFDKVLYFLDK
jgi:hypothetical protein